MIKKSALLVSAAVVAALLAAPLRGQDTKPTAAPDAGKGEMKMTKTPSGLQYEDVKVGTGDSPKKGQLAVVHYTGWLWQNGVKGNKFDSSVDRGQPITFPIGSGRVIKGWDEGLMTMKVGGQRILLIPPDLAYGASGRPPVIPANSTLIFEVELLELK